MCESAKLRIPFIDTMLTSCTLGKNCCLESAQTPFTKVILMKSEDRLTYCVQECTHCMALAMLILLREFSKQLHQITAEYSKSPIIFWRFLCIAITRYKQCSRLGSNTCSPGQHVHTVRVRKLQAFITDVATPWFASTALMTRVNASANVYFCY